MNWLWKYTRSRSDGNSSMFSISAEYHEDDNQTHMNTARHFRTFEIKNKRIVRKEREDKIDRKPRNLLHDLLHNDPDFSQQWDEGSHQFSSQHPWS